MVWHAIAQTCNSTASLASYPAGNFQCRRSPAPVQVRRLQRQRGIQLTPTELLASSLAKLALGVESLTAEARAQAQAATLLTAPGQPAEEPPALMLFAGRRSTSRRFLLLQNWYCMQYLPHYGGTSAVMAVTLLRKLLQQQQQQAEAEGGSCSLPQQYHQQQQGETEGGACRQQQQQGQQLQQPPPQQQEELEDPAGSASQQLGQPDGEQPQQGAGAGERQQQGAGAGEQQPGQPLLRLVGTLAHEVMMVCDQLLGCFDELSSTAGSIAECPGLAQVCALLAHLLLLAAGGGVQAATALSDTFGEGPAGPAGPAGIAEPAAPAKPARTAGPAEPAEHAEPAGPACLRVARSGAWLAWPSQERCHMGAVSSRATACGLVLGRHGGWQPETGRFLGHCSAALGIPA